MKTQKNRERVTFITTEDGDDLIVSFAIEDDEPGEIVSLILLRTPKYESLLVEGERGVSVSLESEFDDNEDYLRRIRLGAPVTTIETTCKRYELDVSRVDSSELKAARRILRRMNFDRRFVLELG